MNETVPQTDQPPGTRSRWWVIVPLLLGLVVGLLVAQFEPVPIAKAAGTSAGSVLFGGWVFWDLRRERWYWPYIALALILHALLICLVPWPGDSPAGHKDRFILIGFADLLAMMGLGWLASKVTGAPSSQPDAATKGQG